MCLLTYSDQKRIGEIRILYNIRRMIKIALLYNTSTAFFDQRIFDYKKLFH